MGERVLINVLDLLFGIGNELPVKGFHVSYGGRYVAPVLSRLKGENSGGKEIVRIVNAIPLEVVVITRATDIVRKGSDVDELGVVFAVVIHERLSGRATIASGDAALVRLGDKLISCELSHSAVIGLARENARSAIHQLRVCDMKLMREICEKPPAASKASKRRLD